LSIPYTWIYLIYDPFTELYKIGKADDVHKRLKQLRSPSNYGTIPAAPTEYQIYEAWLCPEATEKELHHYYENFCARGEWFDLTEEEIEEIEERLDIYPRLCSETPKRVAQLENQVWALERRLEMLTNCVRFFGLRIGWLRRTLFHKDRRLDQVFNLRALPPYRPEQDQTIH
jgi:hypothetical protein